MKFPPPNATRLEVMRFLREHKAGQFEPKHEAPPGDKGSSIVCNECGACPLEQAAVRIVQESQWRLTFHRPVISYG